MSSTTEEASMTDMTRRRMMDRKIVEMLRGGASVKAVARMMRVAKRRIRTLREQAKEYGYLEADGRLGPAALPPYPEAIFPDPVDGRSLRLSEAHQLLRPHQSWVQESPGTGRDAPL